MRVDRHIPLAEASDELLMELVVLGKKEALRELYERYFSLLCRFAHGFLKDEAKAEDAVQEVFIRILNQRNQFDTGRKFRSWMFTLCANHCKNILRDEANRTRILQTEQKDKESLEEPNYNLDQVRLKEEIKRLLARCSEKEKQLYNLRFEMDLSVKEIAGIMELPEGSVKSGLFYLIKKLSTPLKAIIHEYQ
ncbi:MAG: sigma-70 family RNA polymerase sigma factor [Bacteroidetes bacterium]|nr:sigma-70 family RNA polymerase sigma factor [Bacteroidota bacterium]